jgi:hypothetical protein
LTGAIYERSRRQFAAGEAARDALRTPAQVEARREAARTALLAGIGGLPPMDTPLAARTTGEVRGDGFRIEKVLFQSRPGHYVTALLYLPDQRPAERSGAVLFLCGHHDVGKVVDEYQSVCQTLARAGLIVLAQDPIGQGERFSYDEPGQTGPGAVGVGVLEHDYAGAQCRLLGDGLARYMLHDAMRGSITSAVGPRWIPRGSASRAIPGRHPDESGDVGGSPRGGGGAGDVHHVARVLPTHRAGAGCRADLAGLYGGGI